MGKTLKKERYTVPGTLVKCQSGRYLAYYEHRTDIIANGENETDAIKNLKKMYNVIKKNEETESDTKQVVLPAHTKTKSFSETLSSI
jgi:hypothetical protein